MALLGAAVMIGLNVVSQDEAFYSHEFASTTRWCFC